MNVGLVVVGLLAPSELGGEASSLPIDPRKRWKWPEGRQKSRRLKVQFWEVDLETGGNPLQEEYYRAILVFHYLYRPLIPYIRKGIRKGGILIYETFTSEQPKYGHPHNPDYLLQPGELADWFQDWQIIHYFEGLLEDPRRAVAQIVCRKPGQQVSAHRGVRSRAELELEDEAAAESDMEPKVLDAE